MSAIADILQNGRPAYNTEVDRIMNDTDETWSDPEFRGWFVRTGTRIVNLKGDRCTYDSMMQAICEEGRPSPAWVKALVGVLQEKTEIRKLPRLRLVVSNKSKKLRKVPRLARR
jgi:hypothetical protein